MKFTKNEAEARLIGQITKKVFGAWFLADRNTTRDTLSIMMDLDACHANGCPLDLQRMLEADSDSLINDVLGIAVNLDRDTGRLQNGYIPRFALANTVAKYFVKSSITPSDKKQIYIAAVYLAVEPNFCGDFPQDAFTNTMAKLCNGPVTGWSYVLQEEVPSQKIEVSNDFVPEDLPDVLKARLWGQKHGK